MSPIKPNFKPGVGRLVTDRFDFQNHVDGYNFRHKAKQIDLFPTVVIGTPQNNVQDAIAALSTFILPPVIPDATTSSKGLIQLSGDIAGTATSVSVTKIQGRGVSNTPPSTNNVLTWNGSSWIPQAVNGTLITISGIGSWADGTTNPSTFVNTEIIKIVADLSATTGDVKVGAPARAGSPVSLSAGSVGTQVSALLTALNSFENQKAAASGLASLDGSTLVPYAQLPGKKVVNYFVQLGPFGDGNPVLSASKTWVTGATLSVTGVLAGDTILVFAIGGGYHSAPTGTNNLRLLITGPGGYSSNSHTPTDTGIDIFPFSAPAYAYKDNSFTSDSYGTASVLHEAGPDTTPITTGGTYTVALQHALSAAGFGSGAHNFIVALLLR
jgi:hypothetical protein